MSCILVVDDDEDLRESIAQVLERAHCHVRQAPNGAEALALAQEHLPRAILLDLQMPVLDGRGFLKARRDRPPLAAVPVVVMSALQTEMEGLRQEFPGVRLLPKPFSVAQLRAVVAEVAPRSMENRGKT